MGYITEPPTPLTENYELGYLGLEFMSKQKPWLGVPTPQHAFGFKSS